MIAPHNVLTAALCLTLFSITYKTQIIGVALDLPSTDGYEGYYVWAIIFYPVALFFGALASWPLSVKLDRKPVLLASISVLLLSGILSVSAGSYGLLIAGHVICGLAAGVAYVIALVWQIEAAEAGHRGRRAVALHVAAVAGSAFAAWMQYAFSYAYTYNSRIRAPIALQFIFLVPAAVLVYFSPESWRSVLQRHQPDRARYILEHSNHNLASSFETLLMHSRYTSPTLLTCCTSRSKSFNHNLRPYRRLALAALLQVMQVYAGIGTASTYMYNDTFALFSNSYISTGPYALDAALPTIQLVFTFVPLLLIDRPLKLLGGRRNLLVISVLGMAACFLPPIIAGGVDANQFYGYFETGVTSKINFAFFLISNLFYAMGLGPIPDLYTAEIAPSNIRVAVVAVAFAVGAAFSVMYQWLYAYMVHLGYRLFIIWMFFDIAIAVLVWLLYPETARKGLESIDLAFARGMRIFVFKDREARSVKRGNYNEGQELHDAYAFGDAAELEPRRSIEVAIERQEHSVDQMKL